MGQRYVYRISRRIIQEGWREILHRDGTNGILLNEEQVKKILAEHDIKAIVSMDGREETHDTLRRKRGGQGSFRQVDAEVHLLNRFGVELGFSMVVGKHNVHQLIPKSHSGLADAYHPVSLGVNYMKPPTRSQKDFPFLINPGEYVDSMYEAFRLFRDTGLFFELVYRKVHPFVVRKFRYHDCGAAAGTTINIDAKGNIGPCKSFLVLNTLTEKMKVPSGCTSKKPFVLDSLQMRSPVYIDKCQGCEAIGICGNACAYEAWVQSGNMMDRDMRACEYVPIVL